MIHPSLSAIIETLLPLLRSFCPGEYGIALGGAHAKGADDPESDLDLYVFAREVLPLAERDRLCTAFSTRISSVVSWGEDGALVQGGTDFYFDQKKVEVWFRGIDYIGHIISECQAGIARHDYVVWTVMGYFNYCTLSDLNKMQPVEDRRGILAGWKTQVAVFPPLLRQRIILENLQAANFWPENFHYKTAITRCDVLYTTGIVQQVVQNLVQVVFALNEVYFPGEKKLAAAIRHLATKPGDFAQRIQRLVFPQVEPSVDELEQQRQELVRLVGEAGELAGRAGFAL